jgi:hypothetical protein
LDPYDILTFLRPAALVLKLIRMVFHLLKESTFERRRETKPYVPPLVLAVVVGNVFEILHLLCVDTLELEGQILEESFFELF